MRWKNKYQNDKVKMTEYELGTLSVDTITFQTEDKKGNVKIWETNDEVDHSCLCDGWDTKQFDFVEKI